MLTNRQLLTTKFIILFIGKIRSCHFAIAGFTYFVRFVTNSMIPNVPAEPDNGLYTMAPRKAPGQCGQSLYNKRNHHKFTDFHKNSIALHFVYPSLTVINPNSAMMASDDSNICRFSKSVSFLCCMITERFAKGKRVDALTVQPPMPLSFFAIRFLVFRSPRASHEVGCACAL